MRVVALLLTTALATKQLESPIGRVVQLIEDLKQKAKQDGKAEASAYDKFACWCEETTGRKTAAIADAKTSIEELSKSILELKGSLGSFVAELSQLKKDIVENKASTAKAEEIRAKENADYLKEKGELEQGAANLQKAITVLSGGTTGFTPAMLETRMLTVAAGVRSAMHVYSRSNAADSQEMGQVKSFLGNPVSWAEVKANPATGTYQTQSGAIQGILDQMLEDFQTNLANSQQQEETRAADFANFKATKTSELQMLEDALATKNSENGGDSKQLADDTAERKDTEKQLAMDEEFLETTTDSCRKKANEWAERSRLRTEEMAGMGQAIDILTSDEAQATFAGSDSTFLQTSMKGIQRSKAYNILKTVASKTKSLRLAAMASTVYMSGHFDSVVASVQKQIESLREEEKADEDHKKWCDLERSNSNSKNENLENDKQSLEAKLERLANKKAEHERAIAKTEQDKTDLKAAMDAALENRNAEHEAFKQATKDDTDAASLVGKAIEALSAFYTNNGLALVQKPHSHLAVAKRMQAEQPEYAASADTAPEVFEDENYGGRSSENTGIVSILAGIKEDMQNEMKVARTEEGESAAAYQKQTEESRAATKAMEEKIANLNGLIAEGMKASADTQAIHDDKSADKSATDAYLEELKPNCDWIDRTFGDRREKRKAEIQGLQDAKGALAGAAPEAPELLSTVRVPGKHTVDEELRNLDSLGQRYDAFLQRRQ